MFEKSCEIVEMPNGEMAALMPLPGVSEQHWVAVEQGTDVLRAKGHVHLPTMSWRVASRPWSESWRSVGTRDVVVVQPDEDFELGGGD